MHHLISLCLLSSLTPPSLQMTHELVTVLRCKSSTDAKACLPVYGRQPQGFLSHAVAPIYEVIAAEAGRASSGSAPHSSWRNYDDLNEFFWSRRCFDLGWPISVRSGQGASFFGPPGALQASRQLAGPPAGKRGSKGRGGGGAVVPAPAGVVDDEAEKKRGKGGGRAAGKGPGKNGFVEHRTVLHLFRDFDRMWAFFIVALQVRGQGGGGDGRTDGRREGRLDGRDKDSRRKGREGERAPHNSVPATACA